MRDEFAEVLEGLAKVEDDHVEPVLFLIDQDAIRLAAAWRRLKKERSAPATPPPAEDSARWNWLWAQVSFSVEDWAGLANVPLPVVRRLARVLIDNRVIYPDGTLNLFAGKHVQRRAIKMGLAEGKG